MRSKANPSPTGTACLIGKARLLEHVHARSPAPSRPRTPTKTSQMGISIYIVHLPHPKSPPIAPNSEQAPPASFLVIFTCIYIFPPPAELPPAPRPLYRHPRHLKHLSRPYKHTPPTPGTPGSHRACDLNLGGGQNPVWTHQAYGLYPVFDIRI
jgi:hypothetical protein